VAVKRAGVREKGFDTCSRRAWAEKDNGNKIYNDEM
jgi:hypothetical protein